MVGGAADQYLPSNRRSPAREVAPQGALTQVWSWCDGTNQALRLRIWSKRTVSPPGSERPEGAFPGGAFGRWRPGSRAGSGPTGWGGHREDPAPTATARLRFPVGCPPRGRHGYRGNFRRCGGGWGAAGGEGEEGGHGRHQPVSDYDQVHGKGGARADGGRQRRGPGEVRGGAAGSNLAARCPDRSNAVIPARRHRSHPRIVHTTTKTTIRTSPVLALSQGSRR